MVNCDLSERLVFSETDDGIQLDGVLIRPDHIRGGPAIVWLHGFATNFYFPPYLRLTRAVAAHGYAVVTGNTRGHDFGALLTRKRGEGFRGGAAWERVDESPHDVEAWIDFAERCGFPGIVLAGHSLGAVKATYYLAHGTPPHSA